MFKKHPGRLKAVAFFVLLLLIVQPILAADVYAQTGAGISILPAEINLYLNGTNLTTVEVWVTDVVNINTFDITFHYDPAVVALNGWEHGGILINPSQLRNVHDPIAGTLRLSFVQLGGAGFSGDGVLLRLTFQGGSLGTSYLSMDPAKLWSAGNLVPLTFQNGSIITGYQPGVIVNTSLSGSIDLQGRTNRGGVPVALSYGQNLGQGPYTVPTTDVSGNNLSFPSVAMDVYTVSTAQAGYLNISPGMGKQIALLASGNLLPPLRLLGGNAIWTNNEIDIFDVGLVSGEIGKTTFIADADINNDGKVDIFDLALVAGNFGMTSENAYADWMP